AAVERHDLRETHAMTGNPRVRRAVQATVSTVVLIGLWQIASLFFPHYLFPPVQDVVSRLADIFVSVPLLVEILVTAGRLLAPLLGAFVLGAVVAPMIGRSPAIGNFVNPLLLFLP